MKAEEIREKLEQVPTLTINMDARCARCHKKGATPSGICLSCAATMVVTGEMATWIAAGKAKEHANDAQKDRLGEVIARMATVLDKEKAENDARG